MAASMLASMFFEEISDLTSSLETLLALVNQNLFCWQSVIRHIDNDISIYPQMLPENTDLQSWVELLESENKQLVQAQNQTRQSIGEKCVYKQNIQNLTEQLR